MKNQFIDILRTLNKDEVKNLLLFVDSPYFNKSERLIKLFRELVKIHPDYNNITSEEIHKRVFPHLEYNDSTMRRLFSDCDKVLKEFLKYVNYEKNAFRVNEIYREELTGRALSELQAANTFEMENMFNQNGMFEDLYFLYRSNFEADNSVFSYINKKLIKTGKVRSEIENLSNSANYLFIYFLIRNIKLFINIKNYQSLYSTSTNADDIKATIERIFNLYGEEEIKKYFIIKNYDYSFIYTIYLHLFKAFAYPNEKGHYFELKSLLNKNIDKFIIYERQYLVKSLIAYCDVMRNHPDNPKMKEQFDDELIYLYELTLKKKYYATGASPYLSLNIFRNILIIAINSGKIKWAQKFIKIYSDKLNPKQKEDAVNYSYGRLHFAQKDYAKALTYFNQLQTNDANLRNDEKNMALIINYELGNFQNLDYLLPAHKKYFKRNTLLSKDRKKFYLTFNSFLDRLNKLNGYRNFIYINRFIEDIKATPTLLYGSWFKEKANELLVERRKTA
ncbi:MAG TPA: hypothetical protein VHP32_10215 [Ignavibacteria bacterium]|nr:hypothetical protein [Ignavibacteria bacterium]